MEIESCPDIQLCNSDPIQKMTEEEGSAIILYSANYIDMQQQGNPFSVGIQLTYNWILRCDGIQDRIRSILKNMGS